MLRSVAVLLQYSFADQGIVAVALSDCSILVRRLELLGDAALDVIMAVTFHDRYRQVVASALMNLPLSTLRILPTHPHVTCLGSPRFCTACKAAMGGPAFRQVEGMHLQCCPHLAL